MNELLRLVLLLLVSFSLVIISVAIYSVTLYSPIAFICLIVGTIGTIFSLYKILKGSYNKDFTKGLNTKPSINKQRYLRKTW